MCMEDLVWQDSFRLLHYHSLLVCFSSSPHNFANCRYQVYVLKYVEEILVFLNLKEQTKKIMLLVETPLQIISTDKLKNQTSSNLVHRCMMAYHAQHVQQRLGCQSSLIDQTYNMKQRQYMFFTSPAGIIQ